MSTSVLAAAPARGRERARCPARSWPGAARRPARARPAQAVGLAGPVRRRGRCGVHHRAGRVAAERLRLVDRRLALAHRPVRDPRGVGRRGPRQGAGRQPARDAAGDHGPQGARAGWSGSSDVPTAQVASSSLRVGDLVIVVAGETIPGDGDVIEGVASVDESAITGESAPVIRESGGDRSAVTGGTVVLSDRIVVRITAPAGHTFVDRMIALVEGSERQKTPNEVALNVLLTTLTIVFLLAVVTLQPFAVYSGGPSAAHRARRAAGLPDPDDHRRAAVGHRHRGHGPAGPAQRARDVRPRGRGRGRRRRAAAGQDRHHHAGQPPGGRPAAGRRHHARRRSPTPRSCPRWPTRRPRVASVLVLVKERFGLRERHDLAGAELVPFAARTRMSGVDLPGAVGPQGRRGRRDALGALDGRPRRAGRRGHGRRDLGLGRHAAGRRGAVRAGARARARRDPPQGRGQGRDAREVRRAAGDGHPHGHGHGRQPADGPGHRGRGGRRRRAGRGDARGQARADPSGAGGRTAGRDVRRRHQRRPRARAGGRRRRDEHGHDRGEGGRQHGRPRLEPDQAAGDRRDRQAAAHHARGAHHVLGGQRRRQVLRDPAGDVRRRVPAAGRAQRHAPVVARSPPSSRPSSSTRW